MARHVGIHASLVAIALGAIAPAAIASAAELRIFEDHPHPSIQRKTTAFAINAELGRAWVEVTFDAASPEDRPEVVRVRVPGLRYDAATKAIVFQDEDRIVECARVELRGRGAFARHAISPTGRCELTHRYVRVPIDDGFAIEDVQRFEVHLKTAP
jgi:hypothetical protein